MMLSLLPIVGFWLTAIFSTVHAIPTVSVVGSKFFTSDGQQFYIKGEKIPR